MKTEKFIVEVDYYLLDGEDHDPVDGDLIADGIIEVMQSMAMDGEIKHFEGIEVVKETTDFIRMPYDQFEELVKASAFLEALKAAGVDNWDGYEYAHELLNEEE